MSCIVCNCGAKYDRVASHKKEVLGFTCSHCRSKWKTHATVDDQGQAKLFFEYYSCSCGSHPLNIPPKLTRCICEVVDLR